jgi:hypothetical protein
MKNLFSFNWIAQEEDLNLLSDLTENDSWLKIHHPELLVPKADAQEGSKTTSQAKTAQKPSETPSREIIIAQGAKARQTPP